MDEALPPARERHRRAGRPLAGLAFPLLLAATLAVGGCEYLNSPRVQFTLRVETAQTMAADGKPAEARDEFRELCQMTDLSPTMRSVAARDLLDLRAQDVHTPATREDLTAIRTYVAEFNNLPDDLQTLQGMEAMAVQLLTDWAAQIGAATPDDAVAAHQVLAATAQLSDDPEVRALRDAAGRRITGEP